MEEIYKKALIKAQNVNFSYFINLAMSAKITWTELGNILDDLTPSIEKSKQLNKVFLREFEFLHLQKSETIISENRFHSNGDDDAIVNDEELSKHDESLDNDNIEQSDQFQAHDENLELDEGDTEQLQEKGKSEKGHLVNFFSHIDENLNSDDLMQKFENVGKKKHHCEDCDKSFSYLSDLKSHKKIHTGEKPFQCKICSKSFRWKVGLSNHEKIIHSTNKNLPNPHKCQFCKKYFKSHSEKERHERIHTGERPFKCNVCQTRFSETGALKGHEKVHTGAKPFECKICGKIFVRNQHLKAHVVTQHAKDKEIPTLMK